MWRDIISTIIEKLFFSLCIFTTVVKLYIDLKKRNNLKKKKEIILVVKNAKIYFKNFENKFDTSYHLSKLLFYLETMVFHF